MYDRGGAEKEAYQPPSPHSRNRRNARNALGGLEALAGMPVEDSGTRHSGKREPSRPLNGPCLVYDPKAENGEGGYRLNVGKTLEASGKENPYWRTRQGKEELLIMIKEIPIAKVGL